MAGSLSGSKSKQTSTQESNPWGPWQPYAQDIYGEAKGLYGQGPAAYYPGATYTPFNEIQQQGFDATLNRAQGSQQEADMGNYISNTMRQPNFDLSTAGMAGNMAAQGVAPGMQGLMQQQRGVAPGQALGFAGAGMDNAMSAGQSMGFAGANMNAPMSAGQARGMSGAGMSGPMSAGQALGFSGAGMSGPMGMGQSMGVANTGLSGPMGAGQSRSFANAGLDGPMSMGQAGQLSRAGMSGPMGMGQTSGFSRSQDAGLNNPYLGMLGQAGNYANRLLGEDPTLHGRISDVQSRVNTGVDPRTQAALGQTASGAMLNANPYLDAQFNRAAQNVSDQFKNTVTPGINQTFGAAGRTGSRAHTGAMGEAQGNLGDTLGNLATDIYGGNYATERQNQLAAAGELGGLGMQGNQLGLSAAGLGADVYKSDAARQLGAAGLANNMFGNVSGDLRAGQGLNLGQNQLAANMFNQGQGMQLGQNQLANQAYQQGQDRQLGANQFAGSMFNQGQANQLAANQLASSHFNQGQNRQLGVNQLASSNFNQGQDRQLGVNQLTSSNYNQGQDRQLNVNRFAGDMYNQGQDRRLNVNRLGADLFNQGQNRALTASQGLLQGGLSGAGLMGDLYSRIGNQQQGAAGMVPAHSQMQWNNLAQQQGVGNQIQGQSERILQDDMNRFNYYQNAPTNHLANYMSMIFGGGIPTSSSGSSSGKSGSFGIGFG